MSAQECRAHALALTASADRCSSYALILQLEALARDWRKLGDVADLQTNLLAALQAAGAATSTDAKAPS